MTLMKTSTMEQKMWSRVFDDGLWDLYLWIVFTNVAVYMLGGELDWSVAQTAIPFFVILLGAHQLLMAAKRRVTAPRIGYFKPHKKRRTEIGTVGAISVAVSILMVATTVLAVTGTFSGDIPLTLVLFGLLALKMVVLFSLAAHFLGVTRFYAYAALGAAGMVGAEIAVATADVARGWDVIAMFGAPAVVMLPTGLVLLSRFLKDYPKAEDPGPETEDAGPETEDAA